MDAGQTGRETTASSMASSARAQKLRVGFVLTPRFTLTAFAGFIDALAWRPTRATAAGKSVANGRFSVPRAPRFERAAVHRWYRSTDREPRAFRLHRCRRRAAARRAEGAGGDLRVSTFSGRRRAWRWSGCAPDTFVLARAGLLDGYVSCVSWFHREDFIRELPKLRLVSNRVFVADRDRLTCAGGTRVVHLAAHLIEKHCGRAHATKSLRILIEDQPFPASMPQPEAVVSQRAQDGLVRRAMLLIEQKLAQPDSIASIASRARNRHAANCSVASSTMWDDSARVPPRAEACARRVDGAAYGPCADRCRARVRVWRLLALFAGFHAPVQRRAVPVSADGPYQAGRRRP